MTPWQVVAGDLWIPLLLLPVKPLIFDLTFPRAFLLALRLAAFFVSVVESVVQADRVSTAASSNFLQAPNALVQAFS